MSDARGFAPARPDWIALGAAAVTLALHLILQARGPNPYFIIGACAFWLAYVCLRAWQDRDQLQRWGFRTDNLREASLVPLAILIVVASGFAGYAYARGTLRFPLHFLLLLVLYPAFGLMQQLLVLGVVVNNLERLPRLGSKKVLVVFLGAALFGLTHWPDGWIIVATFFLELLLIPLYLEYRNLWPLGVLHGWLGAFFYLWVMGRDMWVENFGQ